MDPKLEKEIMTEQSKVNGKPMVELTWEQFVKRYQPQKNHIDPEAEDYGGCLYGTVSPEFNFAVDPWWDPCLTWTLVQGRGCVMIVEGVQKNALGYFVTRIPYDPAYTYEVDRDSFDA